MSDDFAGLRGHEQRPDGPVRGAIIMLHGYGSNGADLFGLAPVLAPHLPGIAFLAPNGPMRCELAESDADQSYQWFGLYQVDDATRAQQFERARRILHGYLDAQIERLGVPAGKILLLGFSQGTMMALDVAPRRKDQLAGVLGYSGMLLAGDRLPHEMKSKPPVMLVHGEEDPVVAFDSLAASTEALQQAGIEVSALPRPGLDHSIDEEGLGQGLRFAAEKLGVFPAARPVKAE